MNVMTSTITNHFLLSIIAILLLSHLPPGGAYTILGGLPPEPTDENDANNQTQESNPNNNAETITTTLRHFQNRQIHLQTQSREKHTGRLSMAGTLWEAGPVLADYVTNPGCPLHSFRRMRVHADSNGNVVLPAHPPTTVVELGSGVGFASLAAAFLGCRVLGTDGALSSVELLKENFGRYDGEFGEGAKPKGLLLEWGDSEAVRELIERELEGCFPDVVMASDVVYAHSAREELDKTIRELCPEGHLDGRVVVAHRWRVDPKGEEAFFRGFEDEFEVEEVPVELLPPDPYYRTRSLIDFKLPVSIFEMRRKW